MKIKNLLEINDIKDIFNQNSYISIYQDHGLNSKETVEISRKIKQNNLKIQKLKNSLTRIALTNTKFINCMYLFEGSNILVYSNSYNFEMYSLHKKFNKISPVGGIINNNYLSAKQFDWIINLSYPLEPYLQINNTLNLPIETNLNLLLLQKNIIQNLIKSHS